MSRLKPCMGVLLACLSGWQVTNAWAEKVQSSKPLLYIGIENRRPYAYFDDNQQPQGVLVKNITSACQNLGLSCHFVGGLFTELVQSLQHIKLNAVLVIDPALPPEVDALKLTHPSNIDHLKLTEPLCHITPTFLQKKSESTRNKPEDFKDKTIGVREGSIFHSYLLAKYGTARLRLYPLLESAVLDLVFNRIDAVLGDEAFFSARVFESALDEYADLADTPVDKPGLFVPGMALAVRERDTDLLKQLNVALNPTSQTKTCTELLAVASVKPSKSNP